MPRYCPVCDAEATLKCSKCKRISYCSPEHQLEHWQVHKLNCFVPGDEDWKEAELLCTLLENGVNSMRDNDSGQRSRSGAGICIRQIESVLNKVKGYLEKNVDDIRDSDRGVGSSTEKEKVRTKALKKKRVKLFCFVEKQGLEYLVRVIQESPKYNYPPTLAIHVMSLFVDKTNNVIEATWVGQYFVHHGGLRATLAAMKQFSQDHDVQWNGVNFMGKLLENHSRLRPFVATELLKSGGVEVLMDYLRLLYRACGKTPVNNSLTSLYGMLHFCSEHLSHNSFLFKTRMVECGVLPVLGQILSMLWVQPRTVITYHVVRCTVANVRYLVCSCRNCFETQHCNYCGKSPPEMFVCSKCQMARYCNTDCQQKDSKKHKKACLYMPEIREKTQTDARCEEMELIHRTVGNMEQDVNQLSLGEFLNVQVKLMRTKDREEIMDSFIRLGKARPSHLTIPGIKASCSDEHIILGKLDEFPDDADLQARGLTLLGSLIMRTRPNDALEFQRSFHLDAKSFFETVTRAIKNTKPMQKYKGAHVTLQFFLHLYSKPNKIVNSR